MTLVRTSASWILTAALLPTFVVARAATAAPTKVTGADPTTAAAQQAETAYNLSVVNGQRIETVTSDDETDEIPNFVTYTDSSRTVFRGYSLVGWSYRIRTAQSPNPPFTHAPKLRPPSGWAVLWGDPSITSHPDLPNVVLIASLAVPDAKFPSGGIMGGVGGVCTPLGGACVARSTDGGQSFSIASCFSDTRPINGFLDTCTGFERVKGHFFDGSSVAITRSGNTFTGYAAFVDSDLGVEAIYRMNDVTSSPAQAFVRDNGRMGSVGSTGIEPDEGDVGGIGTHLRLRARGAELWKMSRDKGDLKVNIHGRNASFVLAARNAAWDLVGKDGDLNPDVPIGTDAQGFPVNVRTGPQFAFDIGRNEVGQEEMRFVYLARSPAGVFLQAGYCPIDLSSSCVTLPAWTAPASQTPGQFHPAIKFGLSDPANHQGTWKVTFQQVVSGGQVVIAEAELVRPDLMPGSPTSNPTTGLTRLTDTTPQSPCPDLRKNDTGAFISSYWGDYDDMGYDPVSKTFTRVFSDSSPACSVRRQFTSTPIHVSAVEMPESRTRRLLVQGALTDLVDLAGGGVHLVPKSIFVGVQVNPAMLTNSDNYEVCLAPTLKARLKFTVGLSPTDSQTIHACVTQGLSHTPAPVTLVLTKLFGTSDGEVHFRANIAGGGDDFRDTSLPCGPFFCDPLIFPPGTAATTISNIAVSPAGTVPFRVTTFTTVGGSLLIDVRGTYDFASNTSQRTFDSVTEPFTIDADGDTCAHTSGPSATLCWKFIRNFDPNGCSVGNIPEDAPRCFDVPPDGFVSNVNDGGLLTIPGIASGTWNVTLTNALEFQP